MSDKLDSLFDHVRGVNPPAAFAPADQVRRRGRQRSHRKALAAGCAVFAVTAVAAGVGTGWPLRSGQDVTPADPTATDTATGTPTAAPAPTGIPAALMLAPADLGPGTWQEFTPEVHEHKDLWYWAELCAAYGSARFPSLAHQLSVQTVGYADGGQVRTPGPEVVGARSTVIEIVERYAAGRGASNLDDVRSVIALCGTATPPPGEAPRRYTIVDSDFAGEESVLVKIELWGFQGATVPPDPTLVDYAAVVRVGDLVATVQSSTQGADRVRTLAERAAARLR